MWLRSRRGKGFLRLRACSWIRESCDGDLRGGEFVKKPWCYGDESALCFGVLRIGEVRNVLLSLSWRPMYCTPDRWGDTCLDLFQYRILSDIPIIYVCVFVTCSGPSPQKLIVPNSNEPPVT